MFFDKDDEEKNRKIGFADLVNSINGNSNQISNKPSFADLVESINPSRISESNKKTKKAVVEELQKVYTPISKTNKKNETEPKMSKEEIEKIVSKSMTQNVTNNKPLYDEKNNRVANKTSLPQVSMTDSTLKGEKTSTQINNEINAIKEADRKNKAIKNGGVDAFNAVVENTLNAIPSGAMSSVAGLANIATTAVATGARGLDFVSSILGNEKISNDMKKAYNDIIDVGSDIKSTADYKQNVNARIENKAVKAAADVVRTVSEVATNELIGAPLGFEGTIFQGLSSGGRSAQEELEKDKNNIGKAISKGAIKGYISYFTEKLFDANILTKDVGKLLKGKGNSASGVVDDLIYKAIKSKSGREIANKIIGVFGENAEEIIEARLDDFVEYLAGDEEFKNGLEWLKEYYGSGEGGETALLTTLSTLLMDMIGMGGGKFDNKIPDILERKAQNFINKGGANIEYNTNNKIDNSGIFFATTFDNQGQIQNINAVEGKQIKNPNPKVQIIPAIVLNNNSEYSEVFTPYNVIDTQTGTIIDTTPYRTLIQAQAEFDKKMINLNQNQVDAINYEIEKAGITIQNKINEVINTTKAQLNADNISKSTENNQAEHSQELANQTTTNMSENLKSLKNEPGKLNFKTNQRERKFTQQISEYKENAKKGNSVQDDITKINTNVLEGISKNKQDSFINEYLRDEVQGHDYYVDNDKIIANSTTTGKLSKGKTFYDKKIDIALRKELKANVISNLENIISTSQIYQSNRKDTKKHTFADTFDRRKSIFNYKGQNYEVMFEIGKKNGINTLYGIEHIKRTQKNRLNLPQLITQSDSQDTQKSGRIS